MSDRHDYGRVPAWARLIFPLALLLLLIYVVAVSTSRAARVEPVPPASPGAIRVVVNGSWVYFDEFYAATATVTVSGCYTIAKNPNGLGHVITMTWSPSCPHTFLSADVTRTEAQP